MPMELFHQIAQPESAEVRRFVVERGLADQVRLRNVTYDEVKADFVAHGGRETPALWDGARLHVGRAACIEALQSLAATPPTTSDAER